MMTYLIPTSELESDLLLGEGDRCHTATGMGGMTVKAGNTENMEAPHQWLFVRDSSATSGLPQQKGH